MLELQSALDDPVSNTQQQVATIRSPYRRIGETVRQQLDVLPPTEWLQEGVLTGIAAKMYEIGVTAQDTHILLEISQSTAHRLHRYSCCDWVSLVFA